MHDLASKTTLFRDLLAPFSAPEPTVFSGQKSAYRMRCEFHMYHDGDELYYAVHNKKGISPLPMEDGGYEMVKDFPRAHQNIQKLMPELLSTLKANPILKKRLFQVEFFTTTRNQVLITLIYRQPLDEIWEKEALLLAKKLNVFIIGRSRGQKIVIGQDYLTEQFQVGGKTFFYHQYESAFSQPNAEICEMMLNWVCQHLSASNDDLLELYCGNGNFTLPMSQYFRKVLATEISKLSVKALRENIEINQINNIDLARLSAEEFGQAWHKIRPFNRLKEANINLENYQFSTVFVDPPRAGINNIGILYLLQNFETIIYISCNPKTLADDLKTLSETHRIIDCAIFDQFPDTHHLECGVILKKK